MMLQAADPGSLDRLHDIVMPPPAPWWPPAPAWYVLGCLLLIFSVGMIWNAMALWRRNRYRRAGLAELATLQSRASQPATVRLLAELVKRVALAAFPRE